VTFASAAFSLLLCDVSVSKSTIAFNLRNRSLASKPSILSIKSIAAFAVAVVDSIHVYRFIDE
jgi:hypothetical protein